VTGISPMTATLLALFGLCGGIGITALGPGGVLPTIGLFTLTGLSPAAVAGTAIVTHVATGALGTTAYTRSGQLRDQATRRTALILASTAVLGTPVGILVNSAVSAQAFGSVLAVFVAAVAGLVWYREFARPAPTAEQHHPHAGTVAAIGCVVSVAAGLVGIGGPMLTVPILVALGVPVLESLASAQAQSVVIAATGTIGYLAQHRIDWPLAVLIGVPELAGVLLGWKIARALPARALKKILIIVLLLLAPYLALHD
jgi:hypothetical protein